MKILQTTLVAVLISGFGANAQNVQTNAPQATVTSTTVKAELQSALQSYRTATVNQEKAAYDKFLNLVYPVLASHKAMLVDGATAENQKAYEAVVNGFNDIITVNRGNDKTKTLASMQKFIELVKN